MKKTLISLTASLLWILSFNAIGAEKDKKLDWIGVFTTDTVPIRGCYVEENYGVFWSSQYFTYVQWADFNNENNYLVHFGRSIDLILEGIATKVQRPYPKANALIGAKFNFVTNFEPLVSKNYYINGKRADGIGWGVVILTGNAVKVKCRK
jgi:hypothetical protein